MDESLLESALASYDTFLHNIGSWFSSHGWTVLGIMLGAWLVRRFGAQLIIRAFHRTIREDLYPTRADREKRIRTLDALIHAVTRFGVYIVAGIMIVSELGVNTAPLLASAGILGIALGFGAQSLIRDFVSGIFIITENQYRVGDIIELDNTAGVVEAITIRTTVIRDLSGNQHHIPNGSIIRTTNMTMGFGGIDENIVVGNETDMPELIALINKIGAEMAEDPVFAKKIKEPPHFLRIISLNRGGIEVKIIGTTGASDSWDVKAELYSRLLPALRKAKISTPTTDFNTVFTRAGTKL